MPTPWRGWQVTNVGHARDLDGAARNSTNCDSSGRKLRRGRA